MSKSKGEHALAIFKAGVSAVPFAGGPIAVLIDEYVPCSTLNSVRRATEILTARLNQLEDRIDCENTNNDEFAELFKSCYLVIVRTHQEEKLQAAVNLLVNILLKNDDPEKLQYTELDHFVRSVDSLSIGAIRVLGILYDVYKNSPKRGNTMSKYSCVFEDIRRKLISNGSKISASLLMGLMEELNSKHLVHLPGAPGARTESYGNYSVELTHLGTCFVEYLLKKT